MTSIEYDNELDALMLEFEEKLETVNGVEIDFHIIPKSLSQNEPTQSINNTNPQTKVQSEDNSIYTSENCDGFVNSFICGWRMVSGWFEGFWSDPKYIHNKKYK